MSPSLARLPKLPAVALAATAAAAVLAAVAPAPGSAQGDYTFLERACRTDNPYLITACYEYVGFSSPQQYGSVVAFRKAPEPGGDEFPLATMDETGGIWGLAYSAGERVVYASAVHKRQVPFGPGGAGAIYRIDLTDRDVEIFARVPDAGTTRSVGWNDPDIVGRDPAGKNSLGDLELSDDGTELFAVNLNDRRVYRVSVPSGVIVGSFAHGAAAEPWAADARPFGLAYHSGRVYHGVINSAESSQARSHLGAFVYRSATDGSEMELVAAAPLQYARGIARVPGILTNPPVDAAIEWLPWKDGRNNLLEGAGRLSVYPQPILSDIAFDDQGRMVVGFGDRHSFMNSGSQIVSMGTIEKPGLGVGDALLGWPADSTWALSTVQEHFYDRTAVADESLLGGLAWLGRPSEIAAAFLWPRAGTTDQYWHGGVWYDEFGQRLLGTRACVGLPISISQREAAESSPSRTRNRVEARPADSPRLGHLYTSNRTLAPQDNEWIPANQIGDLEVLCEVARTPTPGPTVTPTPSPTTTSSPSPTVTHSPTPTFIPTLTPTPTSTQTRVPQPIYLPVGLRDRCDPKPIDVVLIVDASTSMLDETRGGRPKMEAAREAASLFLSHMDGGDQAAIVSFNANARLEHDLTTDRSALENALQRIENREYTRIDLGLAVARSVMSGPGSRHRPDSLPAVVLLTDGRSNPAFSRQPALDEASAVKDYGILLFTVGLGEQVDAHALREMATRPDDFHYAPDGEDLIGVYERLAELIPCPPSSFWPY